MDQHRATQRVRSESHAAHSRLGRHACHSTERNRQCVNPNIDGVCNYIFNNNDIVDSSISYNDMQYGHFIANGGHVRELRR